MNVTNRIKRAIIMIKFIGENKIPGFLVLMSSVVKGGRGCIGINKTKVATDLGDLPRLISASKTIGPKLRGLHGYEVRNDGPTSTTTKTSACGDRHIRIRESRTIK
jgi:hypothetical protein